MSLIVVQQKISTKCLITNHDEFCYIMDRNYVEPLIAGHNSLYDFI